ncbi:uncharacterized protein UV8b_04177 [Ustilaginoidea virens]|uniref:Uncharacterized protein n=1 Tax=Ustilaginoidea virens TaxID=1159556 RepID=A0A8E5MHG9_USTVR|nr:uncharacterized protein UV8b_04177 [Ustilaginoidea virens]QUC19936.1 hypothetical protein UV8b_04177 [Ustilaginoidea virens]
MRIASHRIASHRARGCTAALPGGMGTIPRRWLAFVCRVALALLDPLGWEAALRACVGVDMGVPAPYKPRDERLRDEKLLFPSHCAWGMDVEIALPQPRCLPVFLSCLLSCFLASLLSGKGRGACLLLCVFGGRKV